MQIPWKNLVITTLVVIILALSLTVVHPPINGEENISLTTGWTYTTRTNHTPTPIDLPTQTIYNPIGSEVALKRTLPTEFIMGASLLLRTSHQTIRVMVDGETIFSFGTDRNPPIGKTFGKSWHIVRLPTDYVGKELTVFLNSSYGMYYGVANEVFFGTKSSHVFSIIRKYSFGVVIGVLLLITGAIILCFYAFIRKLTSKTSVILYIAVLASLSGIWIIGESKLVQFFFGMPLILYNLSVITMILLPLPLFSFLSTSYVFGKNSVVKMVTSVHQIFVAACLLMSLLHFFEMHNIVTAFHLILVAEGIAILVVCIKNWRIRVVRVVFFATCILAVTGLVDAMLYYANPTGYGISAVQVGLLLFTMIIGIDAGRHVAASSRDNVFSSAMTQLAYTDTMTGLKNRTAFQQQFDSLEADGEKLENLAIAVADLNFLKMINDTMGHKKGDDMIILCADTLAHAFGRLGSVYRIGGDEFAVIMTDITFAQGNEALNSFKRSVKQYNKFTAKAVFSVAIGLEHFNRAYDNNVNDLFSRADASMYINKSKIKSNFKFPVFDDKPHTDDRIAPVQEETTSETTKNPAKV